MKTTIPILILTLILLTTPKLCCQYFDKDSLYLKTNDDCNNIDPKFINLSKWHIPEEKKCEPLSRICNYLSKNEREKCNTICTFKTESCPLKLNDNCHFSSEWYTPSCDKSFSEIDKPNTTCGRTGSKCRSNNECCTQQCRPYTGCV